MGRWIKSLQVVVVVVVVGVTLPAFAQQPPPAERRTVINLDEEIIEGSSRTPDVVPVVVRPGRPPHKSLIRIRTDFRQQVLSSVARL